MWSPAFHPRPDFRAGGPGPPWWEPPSVRGRQPVGPDGVPMVPRGCTTAGGLRPWFPSCSAGPVPAPSGDSADLSEGDQAAAPGRLVVVRHGQTEWSRSGRHTGRTDLPLLWDGEAQAKAVGARLQGHRFAAVATSPRQRARRTCELAGFLPQATVDPDLAEWDYGDYEGLTTPEIQERRPGWLLWFDGVEGGETIDQVAERADRVIAGARAREGDTLVFAHGHILRIVAARWLGLVPVAGRFFTLGPGAIGVLGWEHDEPVLVHWNVTDGGLFA